MLTINIRRSTGIQHIYTVYPKHHRRSFISRPDGPFIAGSIGLSSAI